MDSDEEQLDHVSASEDEEDDRKHSQLLDAISSMDGKKKHRLSQRTVPTTQISEYNFNASGGKAKVKLHELVGTLKDSVSHGELKKQLRTVEKRNKVVSVPLPKLEKERIERDIAYTNTSKELKKWDTVVEKNRKAEQIIYPLEQPSLKLNTTDQFVQRFKPSTPLEMEVAALLHGSQHIHTKDSELTPAEEKAMKAMSLQEAKERRAELQKYRALLSYKEAKARWQSKIKSKRYHRVLRKEKLKNEKKSLEELQKKDPEAYLEKLDHIKQQHIQERMSLKHRGGSKFAKKQMIYSKFDDQARLAVQEMLQKSKELTQKMDMESDSEDEGVNVDSDENEGATLNNPNVMTTGSSKNPWMSAGKIRKPKTQIYKKPEEIRNKDCENEDSDSENSEDESQKDNITDCHGNNTEDTASDVDNTSSKIDEIFIKIDDKDSYRNKVIKKKFKEKANESKKVQKRKLNSHVTQKEETLIIPEDSDDEDEMITQTLTRKQTLDEIEDNSDDIDDDDNDNADGDEHGVRSSPAKSEMPHGDDTRKKNAANQDEVYVDPKKLFTVESKLKNSASPHLVSNEDDDDDDDGVNPDEEQRMTIAQAFADDDVIEEFSQEKKGIVDRDKPKDIDLTLPGWGDWGGAGIKISKRKKKRFTVKAPPSVPRKDDNLGNVIISELKDSAIRKHQVSELPFPYTNVKQFEQSIRAPVGKTWNPETAYKQLVKPKVVTRLGTVIAPINKSEVFKKEKTNGKRKADISFETTDSDKKKKKNMKGKIKRKQKNKQK